MSGHPLEEILHPKSVAVVGASANPSSQGNSFFSQLVNHGFKGKIYPVNPKYTELQGIKVYPGLSEIPGAVDYVISCVPADEVIKLLDDCSLKKVKAVHLYTARFSETGRREAADLEKSVSEKAKNLGIRIIGPNCMGLYYPREGISFAYDLPKEPGSLGVISQTGGGATIFINIASMRGVRFSKVISYGNALDLDESDYLDYFAGDPETNVIVMYVEGVKKGRRFFDSLRRASEKKPVIVAKGGRGKAGAKAAASHTASLAGSNRIWETAVTQAGAVVARGFEEMADLSVSFYFLPPIKGPRVGITGGGGGPSVFAADACEEAGLDVVPLPDDIREQLKVKAPEIWDWIGNPMDVSILGGFGFTGIDMFKMMAESPDFDLLIGNITEVPLRREKETRVRLMGEAKGYIDIRKQCDKPLMVVLGEKSLGIEAYDNWRWRLTGELREALLSAGLPFYPTVRRAAESARKLIDYYRRRGAY